MIKKLLRKFLGNHSNVMSFQSSMDLVELPIVTLHQGKQKINLILDTGSNNCVIDSNFLKNIQYTMLNSCTNISGLEGNKQKAEICSINMSYKDRNYEFPYIIQDLSAVFGDIKNTTGVTVHGILGSKFFNKYKYVLDFNELIVYSKE